MTENILFSGCATALITPFCDGGIDYPALASLIEYQIKSGVSALVIAGTTGEASTLREKERDELFAFASEAAGGKVKLIFGTGSNDTSKAIEWTKLAKRQGADGSLIVTPYYNKGTVSGIEKHYLSIAEACDLPILLYNVPSRTGVNLSLATVERLADHPLIVGIKEASDSIDRMTALSALSDKISLYAGNDSQIYSCMALGGKGAISVASNVLPSIIIRIASGEGDALYLQRRLLPFIGTLFADTNPAPIKYLMSRLGLCREDIRLPLSMPKEEVSLAIMREYAKLSDLLGQT